MYLNEIKLIGFVGQDAELKSSQNSELVRFDIATKVSWKNRDWASTTRAPSGIASSYGAT